MPRARRSSRSVFIVLGLATVATAAGLVAWPKRGEPAPLHHLTTFAFRV